MKNKIKMSVLVPNAPARLSDCAVVAWTVGAAWTQISAIRTSDLSEPYFPVLFPHQKKIEKGIAFISHFDKLLAPFARKAERTALFADR